MRALSPRRPVSWKAASLGFRRQTEDIFLIHNRGKILNRKLDRIQAFTKRHIQRVIVINQLTPLKLRERISIPIISASASVHQFTPSKRRRPSGGLSKRDSTIFNRRPHKFNLVEYQVPFQERRSTQINHPQL